MGSVDPMDPRVRRSRAAIVDAAIALVCERGTAAISMTELAEAAGLSRPVLYQHFGDRDGILIAAMTALIERDLISGFDPAADPANPEPSIRALVEHLVRYHRFYRALLLGSSALTILRAFTDLFVTFGADTLRQRSGGTVPELRIRELARFLGSAAAMMIAEWVTEGTEPLDPAPMITLLVRQDRTMASVYRTKTPG